MIRLTTRQELREQRAPPPEQAGLGDIGGEFRELLLSNPMASGEAGEPVQIAGVVGGEVVGRMNMISGRVCVDGQTLPTLWGSGYVVPPEHRGSGVGLMILLRMQALPYLVGAVGASQQAAPLYQKLKWVDLVAPRFVLPRRAWPIVERLVRGGPLHAILCRAGDLVLHALGRVFALATRFSTRGLHLEAADRMPEALDPLLAKVDGPAHCPRSAAWINWILSAPAGSPALWLVRDRQGRAVGYFVVSHRRHESGGGGRWRDFVLGSVKDWMTFDRGAVSDTALVRLAIAQLMRLEVDVIDACVAEPEVGAALRRWGLARMGGMHFTFRPSPGTPLANGRYHQLEAWRIRPADGDYFLF